MVIVFKRNFVTSGSDIGENDFKRAFDIIKALICCLQIKYVTLKVTLRVAGAPCCRKALHTIISKFLGFRVHLLGMLIVDYLPQSFNSCSASAQHLYLWLVSVDKKETMDDQIKLAVFDALYSYLGQSSASMKETSNSIPSLSFPPSLVNLFIESINSSRAVCFKVYIRN
jgi:hypothetical protein